MLSKECMDDSTDCGIITPFSSLYDRTPEEDRSTLVTNFFGDDISADEALNTDFHETCSNSSNENSSDCKIYKKNYCFNW